MDHGRAPLTPLLAGCMLAVALSGCGSSSTGPGTTMPPNIDGSYSLTGTYSQGTGSNSGVFGDMVISNQTGTTATDSISVKLKAFGTTFFAVNTAPDAADSVRARAAPGQVSVTNAGSFSVQWSGREVIVGIDSATCCAFTLAFSGTASATSISGNWTLTTDMPSSDHGTFSAAH